MYHVVNIQWDTDNEPIEEFGLPVEVNVPRNIPEEDIADWLSDQYGFLVFSFNII